jgi:ATP/maltotriose-dependent transcriptional regulator MalT/DNA-binding SARP family transcriptional activator
LLKAKLSPPNLGSEVLQRPHLIQALIEHAERPLTLLVADAGYGKTTLLASFAAALHRPVVWYSLMSSDADPVVFGRYLLEGFRRDTPRFGRDLYQVLEDTRPGLRSAEMLGGTLANELAGLKGPPRLLVLDDFHEVADNPNVVAFMETLLRHQPAQVRIVLATRSVPPLGLERMRVRGEVFELDSSHLRLRRDEIARLFAEVYRRPTRDEELAALEEATLGWPTAVHLVHESLRRSDQVTLESVLSDFRASNLELRDYLSSEVFARLDGDSRRLLERTAALARFDADLAATLAGHGDAAQLDALARRGLLRTFGSGSSATYQCHDLVRRYVRQEIEAQGGAPAWRALEGDTAVALAARGIPERALRHFLLAGRVTEAVELLRELAPRLLKQGRAAALLQYLSELPTEPLGSDTSLLIALADARQTLGQWDEAERLYQESLERCRLTGERGLECAALLGLGKVLNLRGKHEQVLGMAERGLAIAHDGGLETRVRLLQMKAGAHFYLGQYRAAVEVLGQVRSMLAASPDPELLLPTVHNLAGAYAAQGKLREASQEFRTALAHVRGTSSPRAPLYLANLAFHLADLGELVEARRAAEEGLLASQRFSNRAQETTCHEALAQVLAQAGDLDGALAELRCAEDLNAELRMEVIAADLLALRGRIFCARGQYRRAVEFLGEAVARLERRPDAPQLTEFRATLAWCELRAGRVRVARDLLHALIAPADVGENDYQRMRVHYWLAEALGSLGERRNVDAHLATALRLVCQNDYLYFLRVQAREEPAPLLRALARGIELGVVAAALVEAGPAIEEPLLRLLATAPPAVGEAAIAVLGEVGGKASRAGFESLAKSRRTLRPAVRTALRHIDERLGRGSGAEAVTQTRIPRLVLFGPPQLQVDGQAIGASAWPSQRAFHLLIYLALHARGGSKEALLEHFWPGRQLAAGRRNFHPTLSYVRKVLPRAGGSAVVRDGEIYRLNPSYPLTCDAWDLDRCVEEARIVSDAERKRAMLERATAQATAPFLEGIYGDWIEPLQTRMRDRVVKLHLEIGALCSAAAEHEPALRHFRQAAELDEYRESTRLRVIECLLRLGDRRAAIVEYEKLKALLRSELDVSPLPETERSFQQLMAGARPGTARMPERGGIDATV